MNKFFEDFCKYLEHDKKMSLNTTEAYARDIKEFEGFLEEKKFNSIEDVTNAEVISYLLKLKNLGKSSATVNRKVASIRSFYNFMIHKNYVAVNPTADIKSPKVQRKDIEFLTMEEVDRLLSLPDRSLKGIRDKAILEILYATGIRVTEIIACNVEDINLRMGFVICNGKHGKARIIPFGRPARAALEEYIYECRGKLIKKNETEENEKPLFVNYYGERITRQGLWKILKEYAISAELGHKITPQILRNSFAAHLVQNGADIKTLQELMGHEDISATQIYLSVSKNRIKDVYDKSHPRA